MYVRERVINMIYNMHYIIAREFLNELYASGIPYSIIKGCPLEFMKNGTFCGRIINDIDILVDRTQAPNVISLLKKNGYSLPNNIQRGEYIAAISSSHQYPMYYKYVGSFYSQVDVNFDVFWGEYQGERFSISSLLENTIDLNFCGCSIKTLPPMKHLIVTVLHHYKEMNSIFHLLGHQAIKARMFDDIKRLLENHPHVFDPEKVYCACSFYKILPYAYYMLYYTNLYYGDNCLDQYVKALECTEGFTLLDKYGLCDYERREWKLCFFDRFDENKVKTFLLDELGEKDIEKVDFNKKIFGAKNED